MQFDIGTRIIVDKNSHFNLQGKTGIVVGYHIRTKSVLVEFDERYDEGHNGNGNCSHGDRISNNCYYVDAKYLKRIQLSEY